MRPDVPGNLDQTSDVLTVKSPQDRIETAGMAAHILSI